MINLVIFLWYFSIEKGIGTGMLIFLFTNGRDFYSCHKVIYSNQGEEEYFTESDIGLLVQLLGGF